MLVLADADVETKLSSDTHQKRYLSARDLDNTNITIRNAPGDLPIVNINMLEKWVYIVRDVKGPHQGVV
jgi:hypothetical protein